MPSTCIENKFEYLPTQTNKLVKEDIITSLQFDWDKAKKEIQKHEEFFEGFNYLNSPRLTYNKKSIEFSIKGYNIELPYNLKHIRDAIQDSENLLELEEDWDDDGADATNFETYKNAVNFIVNYSTHILNRFNMVLKKPFIDITRDGSISVEWNSEKAIFLIIFKKSKNEFAYYYGQEKDTNNPFKYRVKIKEKINNITAEWLKDYLT